MRQQMSTIQKTVAVAAVFFLLASAGCGGPTVPPIVLATGVVTINGEPLPNAKVQFLPTAEGLDGNYMARAVTDDDGKFELKMPGDKPGVCSGECIVVVKEGPTPGRRMTQDALEEMESFRESLANRPIPKAYQNAAETPLRITVKEGQTEYPVELKR